jgi:hypothetical protein
MGEMKGLPSPQLVRSILPALADQAAIDWSRPMATWPPEVMVNFLLLASELLNEADNQELNSSARKFVLTLQAVRGADEIKSLRWALKRLLRGYGLRCVDIREG